jgi:hypothetical protein
VHGKAGFKFNVFPRIRISIGLLWLDEFSAKNALKKNIFDNDRPYQRSLEKKEEKNCQLIAVL